MTVAPAIEATRVGGFRQLRVIGKLRESRTITSFLLEPVEEAGWRPFEAGQFLVFKIPVGDARGFVLRNYSVSSPPDQRGTYRITVKREEAPATGLPAGLASSYLHDAVAIGDVLEAEGPRGDFRLDRSSARPVVLLSGGVGLTPLVSMLHALAAGSDRSVSFIHACDSGDVHALRQEVQSLAATRPGITSHFCYRFPSEADVAAACFDSHGVVGRDVLQRLLPLDDYDFYLCGPPVFMQAVYRLLRGLGVAKPRIAYEFFGPATVLEADCGGPPEPVAGGAGDQPVAPATSETIEVTFRRSGRSAPWNEGAGTLLAFAESLGLDPDFSCRAGICSTCKTRLIDGEVSYVEEPLDDPGPGEVLICCAKPARSVVLDL